jgi:hypothetical protein
VWNNTVNPRDGEPIRYSNYGPIDGGNGAYLDPGYRATDYPTSVLLTPEATMMTDDGSSTRTRGPQVYAEETVLREGDTLVLVYPDGSEEARTIRFTNNGHGVGEICGAAS